MRLQSQKLGHQSARFLETQKASIYSPASRRWNGQQANVRCRRRLHAGFCRPAPGGRKPVTCQAVSGRKCASKHDAPGPRPKRLSGEELAWHAVDTKDYNVNLYHFAYGLNKPTSGVLFWAVTVVNCPEEMAGIRLSIGSNDASVWWVNGQEVIGIYGDRQTVIDDGVSRKLTLKKGPNVIHCAIHNQGGATDFCARFLDQAGNPLKGITLSLTENGRWRRTWEAKARSLAPARFLSRKQTAFFRLTYIPVQCIGLQCLRKIWWPHLQRAAAVVHHGSRRKLRLRDHPESCAGTERRPDPRWSDGMLYPVLHRLEPAMA